jgi:SHS family lactate transporter-like MFS transporter
MGWGALRGWTATERNVVAATYLGWTLDAFDFFVLVFVLTDVAAAFGTAIPAVALAVTLTLAFRPLGAFLFGRLADRYGRRPVLMANIALYTLFGFLTAFAWDLPSFLAVRSLFGVAMGGVWGIGASLAMETIQPKARGIVSGLLQSGYPSGYLLASVVFGLLYGSIGWRGMFMVGVIPAALLILYMYTAVPESRAFDRHAARTSSTLSVMRSHWKIALFAIILMTGFNFFSHGTQDIFPTFLQKQLHFDHGTVSAIAIIYNIGAICGGLLFGGISQAVGRRRAILGAALLSIPAIYLWAFSVTPLLLALGAFLMQFFVQGAWGVVPAHLNELSPREARATFPGTVYQLGNFIASVNAVLQTYIAQQTGDYALALASVALCAALLIAALVKFGPEAHNIEMIGGLPDENAKA